MPHERDHPGRQHQASGRVGDSGVEAYKEFWYSLVGLNGIGQSFDGNGNARSSWSATAARRSARADLDPRQHAKGNRLLTHSPLTPLGTRPAFPTEEPPYEPKVPCYTQKLPEFNGPLANGPADGSG